MILSERGYLGQLPNAPRNVIELDEWRESEKLAPLGGETLPYLTPYDALTGTYRVGGDVSFVYDAETSTLAKDLFEQLEWQDLVQQTGDVKAIFAGAPSNFTSRFNNAFEAMDALGVAGNAERFVELVGRQRLFNSQFAAVRSVVSLGYEQFGWVAGDLKIVTGAFSDLQSRQADVASWVDAASALGQTQVVQHLWDFLKNSELWEEAVDGLASMIGAATQAIPWIGAAISAGIQLPIAILRFQKAREEHRVAELDARASVQLAAVPTAQWDASTQKQAINIADATREASVLRSVQRGLVGDILRAPELGTALTVTSLSVDGFQVGYSVSTTPPSDGIFGGTALVPGTQTLTSGAYVTQTKRSDWPDFGVGKCTETPVGTSSMLGGTLAATSSVAAMVNSRTPTPMLFSVDTNALQPGWEDFIQRQFELLFHFSSGWFCQSNIIVNSGGQMQLEADPAWLCTAALAKQEEGTGMEPASLFSGGSYEPGVLNWPPHRCSVRTFKPHTPINVNESFVIPRGLITNSKETLAEIWRGNPPAGPDRMGLPYEKGYGMVGYSQTANLYKYMINLYFDTEDDPWVTKYFEGRKYSDLKTQPYISGTQKYGTVNPFFDQGQKYGQGMEGNDGTDQRRLKAGRPNENPFKQDVEMWRWFPTPASLRYNRSRPAQTLQNIRTRQMAALVYRHPIIMSVDPDAKVVSEGQTRRVFAAFDDPVLLDGWQQNVGHILNSSAVYGIKLEDVANPQLRAEVAKRKAQGFHQQPFQPEPLPNLPAPNPNALVDPESQEDPPVGSAGMSTAGKVALAAAVGAMGYFAYRRFR